ncbi:MAG: methyltransferase domain-containing protein [Ectothiorhodospiraceae bacterium]|nr:methyltransferase domain-containing protein [Ectothiorhodospiraceae bacterium]
MTERTRLRACTLCGAGSQLRFAVVRGADYLRCPRCDLVWLAAAHRLDREAEREYYDTHENNPHDPGYRAFLNRLVEPLAARLPAGARGLDYGSGPGPTLSVMLEELGFPMRLYDPCFAPDTSVLQSSYDFVTCTETAEHFFRPDREFALLDGLLKPGGLLGLMTGIRLPHHDFQTWHYVRDPTHVSFYSPRTLEWIAAHHCWELELPSKDVAIFRKP